MRGRRGGKDGRCRAAADGVGGRAKLSECGIAECELGPWRAAADGVGGGAGAGRGQLGKGPQGGCLGAADDSSLGQTRPIENQRLAATYRRSEHVLCGNWKQCHLWAGSRRAWQCFGPSRVIFCGLTAQCLLVHNVCSTIFILLLLLSETNFL